MSLQGCAIKRFMYFFGYTINLVFDSGHKTCIIVCAKYVYRPKWIDLQRISFTGGSC